MNYDVINIISYLTFAAILAEYFYSLYKRDGIYATPGTLGNLMTGLAVRYISIPVALYFMGYFFVWYDWLGHDLEKDRTVAAFIACLFVVDLLYYVYHRMSHSIDFLWMFHHVHHGDQKLNLSTAFRFSILQFAFLFLFFAPALIFGFHPFTIFTAYYLLSLYQFYTHSQYIKLPRFVDYVFVTPNNHRIHHDQVSRHQHSNFGAIFSIWDRFFGTYVADIPTLTPGIEGYHQDDFWRMQADPIKEYFTRQWASLCATMKRTRSYVQRF